MRALNRGHVREFKPTRKDPRWGRRKLKSGPMKSYLLMAITGLILCATAGFILMVMILVVSPD